MKKFSDRSTILILVAIMIFGATVVNATTEFEPTIRMGENASMTREEFFAWSTQ
jgi:hypothetical protein